MLERAIRHGIRRYQLHLERPIQIAELQDRTRIDPLTSLLNRQALEAAIAKERSRADRSGAPRSFALIDLDHFKRIKDTYGHLIGDEALKATASLLMNHSREGDHTGRYGCDRE